MPSSEPCSYAYPLQVDASGQLKLVYGADVKRCHIQHVIDTELRENPMRPEYGVNGALFETLPNGARVGSREEYAARVLRALEKYVTGCTFRVDVAIPDDDGNMALSIFWSYNTVRDEEIRL